jgi:putative Mn2+ efflux pump MntP
MWKIFLGFVLFAGLGLFMIFKGGDKVDMGGEKHDMGSHTEAPAAKPAAPASATK